ncbi:MAG: SprT-like domain-containing protein [Bacteroidetes bacterium]|nr:SprT-like domain-containing protein [Bacteroidota bacterium]MDA0888407.1 SprT-like domain-containing protein [Bacteroidota bacterium]MDA1084467.1 SprT-like domain-containing protein [Bacteroidota bacterium]
MNLDFYSFLPTAAQEKCASLIGDNNVQIKVVRQRKTKHGDFRVQRGKPVTITLNAMENPYRFLLTFLHEWAHYVVFTSYRRRQKPHGTTWQNTFQALTTPFLTADFFPEPLLKPLQKHMQKPKATFAADASLVLALRQFDPPNDKKCIFELEEGILFRVSDGRIFQKGTKRRTRFVCTCTQTKRRYLFPPFVQVNEM